MYLKTRGIIIREINTGDSDKILTLLTDRGTIPVSARRVKSSGSRISAGCHLLCYSDYVLFKGRNMYNVNSCDLIHSFYEIRNDIFMLTYAAHMADLIMECVLENQNANDVLKLFLNTLYKIAKGNMSLDLLICIFELRLLTIIGYKPRMEVCALCEADFGEVAGFSFENCGLCCKHCTNAKNTFSIMPATASALIHIINSTPDNIFKFNLSPGNINELRYISSRYVSERLEKNFCKLDFLNEL